MSCYCRGVKVISGYFRDNNQFEFTFLLCRSFIFAKKDSNRSYRIQWKKPSSGTLKVKIVVIEFSDVTHFWSKFSSDTLKFKIVIIEFSAITRCWSKSSSGTLKVKRLISQDNLNVFEPYKFQCTFTDYHISNCNVLLCFIPLMNQLLLLIIKINCIIANSNFGNI